MLRTTDCPYLLTADSMGCWPSCTSVPVHPISVMRDPALDVWEGSPPSFPVHLCGSAGTPHCSAAPCSTAQHPEHPALPCPALPCPALPQLQSCTAAQLCVPALAQHTQQLRDCIQLSATAVPPSALTDTTSWRNRSQEGTALQSEGQTRKAKQRPLCQHSLGGSSSQ